MAKREEWEVRRQHAIDLIDSMCEANGFEKPVHPPGGAKTPKNLFRAFYGSKFWPAFESRGHTEGLFEMCQCRQEWMKEMA